MTSTVDKTVVDPNIELLQEVLPKDKYFFDPKSALFAEGGTRKVYSARWGPGRIPVVLKIQKPSSEIVSPRAQRHTSRGCDTSNEIKMLSRLRDAEKHHISPIRDYFEGKDKKGNKFSISVEPEFESAISLEQLDHPLTLEETVDLSTQLLAATKYYTSNGLLHRDPKPSNVLIRWNDNGGIEARLTDFANGAEMSGIQRKALPTAGGHQITDPLLVSSMSPDGIERAYEIGSEMYALGATIYHAHTKKHIFDIDPDNKTATVVSTRKNLLDNKGRIDKKRYQKALKTALKEIPEPLFGKGGELREVIGRCMSLEERAEAKSSLQKSKQFILGPSQYRYETLSELVSDVESLAKPPVWRRVASHWKAAIAVGALLSAGGAWGYNELSDKWEAEKAVLIKEKEKPNVFSDIDGQGFEITNGLVNISVTDAYAKDKYKDRYPKSANFLTANPGEKITINIEAREGARGKDKKEWNFTSCPSLEGRAYFEGYEGKSISIYPTSHNRADDYSEGWGGWNMIELEVPKDMKGLRNIAIEFYAPTDPENSSSGNVKAFNWDVKGGILTRTRIPVVVGDKSDDIDLKRVGIAGIFNSHSLTFDSTDINDEIPTNRFYRIVMPEEEFDSLNLDKSKIDERQARGDYTKSVTLPVGDSTEMRTLITAVYRINQDGTPGELSSYTGIPLRRQKIGDKFYWEYSTGNHTLPDKLKSGLEWLTAHPPKLSQLDEKSR